MSHNVRGENNIGSLIFTNRRNYVSSAFHNYEALAWHGSYQIAHIPHRRVKIQRRETRYSLL